MAFKTILKSLGSLGSRLSDTSQVAGTLCLTMNSRFSAGCGVPAAAVKKRSVSSTAAMPTGAGLRPRRAVMYVPGSDRKKLEKAVSLNADFLALDFEDGVALNRKEEARSLVGGALGDLSFGRSEVGVRVNSASSQLMEDDLAAVFSYAKLPDSLLLPKVDEPADLDKFADAVNRAIAKGQKPSSPLPLIIYAESARGILNLQPILEAASRLQDKCPCKVEAAVLGSDDLCADLGITRSVDGREIMYARQKFLLTCRAYGLQAIDMVHIEFKDLESLREQSEIGARLGFSGKQVIHPSQVPVVHRAFSPSAEKTEWARGLVEAFEEHQSKGAGAFTFRGNMIDMPLLLQARNILQLQKAIDADSSC